jgi:hypothetical protein
MDIENITKEYLVGTTVNTGAVIGKTGMTWNGKKSQLNDPHLHVEFSVDGTDVATFPYLMEAYLRKFPDEVIAVAGGYRFAVPGENVGLDATRSFTKSGLPAEKFRWKLSNGKNISKPVTAIKYDKPGIYCEELTVQTPEGHQDRDFLYVTVFDPENPHKMACGWAYYYPVRGIRPGDRVLFRNRLTGTASDVIINYGDDSSSEIIKQESTHIFNNAGSYIVTLNSTGPGNQPVCLKMEVIVE